MNKNAYEFSFSWIFAVFVGAVIIFFAIYLTTQIVGTERTKIDTVRAREIGVLLTPVETNLEQAKLATILVPQETRLFTNCSLTGDFGRQRISALTKSGIGDEWQPELGVESSFNNKYIFSEQDIRAEEQFFVFTKPLQYPFKVADLTMIWPDTEKYCFVFPSDSGDKRAIQRELLDLEPENIEKVSTLDACSGDTTKTVCFDVQGCDINVFTGTKKVDKDLETLAYVKSTTSQDEFALLFAAIFSSPEEYNCQMERLTKRAANLADVYRLKSNYLTPKGCSSAPVLPQVLLSYKNSAEATSSLSELKDEAEDLRRRNNALSCRLF